MPNLFVFTSKEDGESLREHLEEETHGVLAYALRKATADALGDLEGGAKDVEVRLITSLASDNATKVQIFCVGSRTPERAGQPDIFQRWANALAYAWKTATEEEGISNRFPLKELGIWPTLPEGEWFLASNICPAP